jgi:hypothetical protein
MGSQGYFKRVEKEGYRCVSPISVLPVLTFLTATSCQAIARIAMVPFFFTIHEAVGQSARALHLPIGSYFHAAQVDKFVRQALLTLAERSHIYMARLKVSMLMLMSCCFQSFRTLRQLLEEKKGGKRYKNKLG